MTVHVDATPLYEAKVGAPAPPAVKADVPEELVAIWEKAMAREPEQRYADMGALAEHLRNYLENRTKYEGSGNFNEEGFSSMQRAIPMASNIIRQASATPGIKLVWGTDAVAGAHGRETDDLICRVREGGQPAMAALISATSGGASMTDL